MSRAVKQMIVGLSCALLLCLGGTLARGDAAPAAGTGSITGTVTGVNGPTAGVMIKVYAAQEKGSKKSKATSTTTKAKHHKHGAALGQATTDSNGAFTIPNLPTGNYMIVATLKGVGSGHAKADLTTASTSVSITLKNHRAKTK